jgi:hypothetical protein
MRGTSGHSAPGQAAGYFYQIERALSRLSSAPADASVAVEKEDDVSVIFKDGRLWLEQDKHTVNLGRPFGDHSRNLWNTLDIWLDGVARGIIDPAKTKFFFVTNDRVEAGLAASMGNATTMEAVHACICQLNRVAADMPEGVKDLAQRVLKYRSESLAAVIYNIECLDSSCDSFGADLRRDVASGLHVPEDVDVEVVLDSLHGWLANQLLELWRKKQPAVIQRQAFDRQYHRLLRNFHRYKRLGLPEHLVHIPKGERDKYKNHRYVRQIRLVRVSVDEMYEAVDDYIRSSTERFRLAKEGDISDDDLKEFEGTLKRKWVEVFRKEIRLRNGEHEEETGYRIMTDTLSVDASLADAATYPYMIKGTYHRLADDATADIGWHPRFRELL